jgi:hypothetical protein
MLASTFGDKRLVGLLAERARTFGDDWVHGGRWDRAGGAEIDRGFALGGVDVLDGVALLSGAVDGAAAHVMAVLTRGGRGDLVDGDELGLHAGADTYTTVDVLFCRYAAAA